MTAGRQARATRAIRTAVVLVKYFGPGGPYKYKFKTNKSRTIQLGKDNDLTENKRIRIKLCIEHHKCTKWAKA